MKLLVDIGNSRVKVASEKEGELSEVDFYSHIGYLEFLDQKLSQRAFSNAIISSTASEEFTDTVGEMLSKFTKVHRLSAASLLPIDIAYDTPKTLGLDRIANVCGAIHFFPGETSLVIDAGTCITYDVLEKGKVYRGGAITPGLQMRFKAMNDYSARLPRLKNVDEIEFPGTSTDQSLKAGVFYGILGEIHQFIKQTEQSFGAHKVLITGGDSLRFEEGIKYPTFANPKLTLWGLYEILTANS